MRLAVITDVHGNAFALEAVLADVADCSPELTLNLGDQVYGRADPGRAFELQQAIGAEEILGNTDARLLSGDPLNVWLKNQLPTGAIDHLSSLPTTCRLLNGAVFACHGSPSDPEGHLLWSWKDGPYEATPAPELRAVVTPLAAQVVLCGHTHREACTVIGDTLVVNVGAVSQQVDHDPRARWALLEERAGRWSVDFRRVSYDWDAAAAWARRHAPDPEDEATTLTGGA